MRLYLVAAVLALAGAYQHVDFTIQQPVSAPPDAKPANLSGARVNVAGSQPLRFSAAAPVPYPVESLLNVPGRMSYGDYVWQDEGIAGGPLWVFVDLTSQTMSVFKGGDEIGATVLLYGADEKPTPRGRFTVLSKSEHNRSRTYDAPMPFTLMLTDSGVAIHGSDVRRGAATHGCLGVPLEFARRLFAEMKLGNEVFITGSPRLVPGRA